MITLADVSARINRLDELVRGLAKELASWKTDSDPLLYLERQAYLSAIQAALKGIETARVVLARACQRARAENCGGR
jgi:hypothetical protein